MAKEMVPEGNDLIFYSTPDGSIKVEVVFQDETFWMTVNRMAELFCSSKQAVSRHLQNIFETGELKREATVKEILTVQIEGGRKVSRNLDYFNLDAIIAVGSMRMTDWVSKLDAFLKFNEYQILNNSGTVSHEIAVRLAEEEYGKFRVIQDRDYENDFEREAKKITDSQDRGKKKT